MNSKKLTPLDILDDKLPMLQAKIAFIYMAACGFAMLTDGDLHAIPNQIKAWEGLEWITGEIVEEIDKWYEQMK